MEQAARAAQAEKKRREAAARAEKAREEAAQAEQAVREKEEKVRREALARAEKERVEAEQAAQAEREETRRGSVTDGAGVTGRHDPPKPRGMCLERRRVHVFPWQRERRARKAAARDTGMEATHVESALAKQQVEMERGEASTPAAGPRTRPPPASPAALLEGLTGAPVGEVIGGGQTGSPPGMDWELTAAERRAYERQYGRASGEARGTVMAQWWRVAATAGDAIMDDELEGAWRGWVKEHYGQVHVDYQKLVGAAVYQNGSEEETVREALRWRRWQWARNREDFEKRCKPQGWHLQPGVPPGALGEWEEDGARELAKELGWTESLARKQWGVERREREETQAAMQAMANRAAAGASSESDSVSDPRVVRQRTR